MSGPAAQPVPKPNRRTKPLAAPSSRIVAISVCPLYALRVPDALMQEIARWGKQHDARSRSEAISQRAQHPSKRARFRRAWAPYRPKHRKNFGRPLLQYLI